MFPLRHFEKYVTVLGQLSIFSGQEATLFPLRYFLFSSFFFVCRSLLIRRSVAARLTYRPLRIHSREDLGAILDDLSSITAAAAPAINL